MRQMQTLWERLRNESFDNLTLQNLSKAKGQEISWPPDQFAWMDVRIVVKRNGKKPNNNKKYKGSKVVKNNDRQRPESARYIEVFQ